MGMRRRSAMSRVCINALLHCNNKSSAIAGRSGPKVPTTEEAAVPMGGCRRASRSPPRSEIVDDFSAAGLQELVRAQGLVFDDDVCEHVVAALDVGSNVILTGPPGTGKTSLAYLAAELG